MPSGTSGVVRLSGAAGGVQVVGVVGQRFDETLSLVC